MGDFEVVGVMPAGFGYPDRATLWLTMEAWYALGLESYREKQLSERSRTCWSMLRCSTGPSTRRWRAV